MPFNLDMGACWYLMLHVVSYTEEDTTECRRRYYRSVSGLGRFMKMCKRATEKEQDRAVRMQSDRGSSVTGFSKTPASTGRRRLSLMCESQ